MNTQTISYSHEIARYSWRLTALPMVIALYFGSPDPAASALISATDTDDSLSLPVSFTVTATKPKEAIEPEATIKPNATIEPNIPKVTNTPKEQHVTATAPRAAKPLPESNAKQAPAVASKKVAKAETKQKPKKQENQTQQHNQNQDIANARVSAIPIVTKPLFASPPKPPKYPTLARKRGQQGTVWLDIWLDEHGQQKKLRVSQSSGLKSLDRSALKAVQQWRFKPYTQDGIRMASRVSLPIEFSLN